MSGTRRKWIACQSVHTSKSGYYSSFNHYTHTHSLLHFALPMSLQTFLCWGTALYTGQVHDIAIVTVCEVDKRLLQRIPVQVHGFFLSSLLSLILSHHSGNTVSNVVLKVTLQKNGHFGHVPIISLMCKINPMAIMHKTINCIRSYMLNNNISSSENALLFKLSSCIQHLKQKIDDL